MLTLLTGGKTETDISLRHDCHRTLKTITNDSRSLISEALSLGIKRTERDIEHSPLSNVDLF
jgi:hypothetical protein